MTDEGQKKLAEIGSRHGVSSAATTQLLAAIAASGGRQAQFNHPELGGMGQWSQGGMIMIGDMFNQRLKAQVAALCSELAAAWQSSPALAPEPDEARPAGRWPAELGTPSSTGSQNDMHYAVFPGARRLAIEQRGTITVYDTGDHRIGGVSQQQSGDQTLRFSSQSGPINLSDLKIFDGKAEAENTTPTDRST